MENTTTKEPEFRILFIDGSTTSVPYRRLRDWDIVLHDFKPWFIYKHRKLYRTNSCYIVTTHIRGYDVPPVITKLDGFWQALKELIYPKILK